jgi:hypothetical protein
MGESAEPVVLQFEKPVVMVESITPLLDGLRMKTVEHPVRLSRIRTKIGRKALV